MLRTLTLILAVVSGVTLSRAHAQSTFELEPIQAAVRRELVPPPVDEWKRYVTEAYGKTLPDPGDEAYDELETMRRQHVNAIARVEVDVRSATFIGDYVLVLAHVLVAYKPNVGTPSPTSENGDLELYQFVYSDHGWLSAAAPFPYTPQSFLQVYTKALGEHAASSDAPVTRGRP